MAARGRKNRLERWEIALIKAMLEKGTFGSDQDILAYFTRPNRSINQGRIWEIRKGIRHARTAPATDEELDLFTQNWPKIDPETGLHLLGDELLIKAREAMLVAVQSYNNPKTHFRSEVFIVTAIIAWTYLLHAYYKKEGVDYRYKYKKVRGGKACVQKTRNGAEKYWDLSQCLKVSECPINGEGTLRNLNFLLDIRHEIEHRMTTRIDDYLSAKLHACCLNFNRTLKALFGDHYGLDQDLSFALQFSGISMDQKKASFVDRGLPEHIDVVRVKYEEGLTDQQYSDPHYAYRVLFVPKIVNKKTQADEVIEFVSADSDEAAEMNRIYLREVSRPRYRPGVVVKKMQDKGFKNFGMRNHTVLWQELDAKNPAEGYGEETESDGWRWNNRWLDAVRKHCEENREKYE